jgi:hypothetical protein
MPPNGLELSCPAAWATAHPFSRIPAGESRSNFPLASRVSCSELLGALGEHKDSGNSPPLTKNEGSHQRQLRQLPSR